MTATPAAADGSTLYRYDPARDPEALLAPEQTGAMIGYTVRKLAQDRQDGVGIPFIRIAANRVRYRRKDIIRWIADLERAQKGEAAPATQARG